MIAAIIVLLGVVFIIRLLAVRPSSAVPDLPIDLIANVSEFADSKPATALGSVSMSLRRVAPLLLNKEFSAKYIFNPDFRALVNSRRHNPRATIRLNLGEFFGSYMVDADFRSLVDG